MSHEPECLLPDFENERFVCICKQVRKAYTRGFEFGYGNAEANYNIAYRKGYNDHARSQALGAEMYGRYNPNDPNCTGREPHMCGWNQHGQGENP